MFGKFPRSKVRRITLPRVNKTTASHNDLQNLDSDDHTQYLTEARHDALAADNPHSVTLTQAVSAEGSTDVTPTELETLTDGSDTTLHIHDSRYYTETECDATFAPIAKGVTNGDSHNHESGDGAQINHIDLSNIGTNTHTDIDTHIADSSIHGSADHGGLTGLGDDDHPVYILVDGTRAFTGTVSGVTPTADPHLATKAYVDSAAGATNLADLSDVSGTPTDGQVLTYVTASGEWIPQSGAGGGDHGGLAGLTDDDHSQYPLLTGRAGGQTLIGGTGSSDDLQLQSTSNATKGIVDVQGVLQVTGLADTQQLIVKNNATQSYTKKAIVIQSSAGSELMSFGTDNGSNYMIGLSAGNALTSGTLNVLIGYLSAASVTTGSQNITIGRQSMYYNQTGSYNLCLGAYAGFGVSGDSFSSCVFIGGDAGFYNQGDYNTAIGRRAMFGNPFTGARNVALGYTAMGSTTTGSDNFGLGYRALNSNTTGFSNTVIGTDAAQYNTTGQSNVVIGYQAGRYTQTGINNVYIGRVAGTGSSGNSNSSNIGIGASALNDITTGSLNVALGTASADALTTGTRNTCLGTYTGRALTTGTDNIIIGYNVNASSASVTYELNIGGLITGDLSNKELKSEGQFEVETTSSVGKEAMIIDQNDTDEPFIDFQGQASANTTDSISTHGTAGTIQGWLQIEVNGTKRWIPFYDDPSA